jgi:hypothetical protein
MLRIRYGEPTKEVPCTTGWSSRELSTFNCPIRYPELFNDIISPPEKPEVSVIVPADLNSRIILPGDNAIYCVPRYVGDFHKEIRQSDRAKIVEGPGNAGGHKGCPLVL